MEWFGVITDWVAANRALFWWLFAVSIAFLLLSPLIVGWIVVRLPADYFVQPDRRPLASWQISPIVRCLLLIAKNAVGLVLVIAGLIMLFTPGQGLLTIVVGITMIDFPGKYQLERWVVKRPGVWKSMNWLRKRAGRPEILWPAN